MILRRLALSLLLFLSLAMAYLLLSCGSGQTQGGEEVDIERRFPSKIVYGTEAEVDTAALEAHCEASGGSFHECGSVCAPDAPVCAEVCAFTCEDLPSEPGGGGDPAPAATYEWTEIRSRAYGFRIRYPSGSWSTHRDTSLSLSPKFNVFRRPPGIPLDLPLDHFANVSHLSVYPKGIPTEGLFGESRSFDGDVPFAVSGESEFFLLEDGAPFAAYLKPTAPPRGWTDAGFLWLRARVEGLEVRCLREGEEVGPEDCDPLMRDDRILRKGRVDQDAWNTGLAMLSEVELGDPGPTVSLEDSIWVERPGPEDTVTTPLQVKGEASGFWFFEGRFPVLLTDWDGRIIAETQARALGPWMTEGPVPFQAVLAFESPHREGDPGYTRGGRLILRKANPSGRPQQDRALEIPVAFSARE